MGLEGTLRRACVQKATYWGNPVADGYGGYNYDDAVEIDCRWEDIQQRVISSAGEEIVSTAVVYPLTDLDNNGMIALSSLDDLDIAPDPRESGARKIIKVEKSAGFGSSVEFVRTCYLK